jgi:hypothetical protein
MQLFKGLFIMPSMTPNPEGCIAAERAGMGAENRPDGVARGASKYTPS